MLVLHLYKRITVRGIHTNYIFAANLTPVFFEHVLGLRNKKG